MKFKYWGFIILFGLVSCEEAYLPSPDVYQKQLVIESIVELSNESLPAYCILSSSFAFDTLLDQSFVDKLYVKDATVHIIQNGIPYNLQQFCLNDLQEPFRSDLIRELGFDPDSIKTNFCVYIDIAREIKPQAGDEFVLQVIQSTDTFISKSLMPQFNAIDSFWFEKPPGRNQNDSFAQLYCIISDNPLQSDFYRYFTAGSEERLIPNLNSVTDDVFFDGKSFKFSLSKAIGPDDDFGDDNSGLYRRGDSVIIKWCTISNEQYDFWNSLEASRTRQGPFSSYIRIQGNVPGALGLFGTQNCTYYSLLVPKI